MAGGIDSYSGSGAIVSGFKIIIRNNYMKEVSNYKYVIHSRFDQFYTDYHPEFKGDKIWIPEGEDYFGICDRHAIISYKHVEQYFSIGEFLSSKQASDNMIDKEIAPESIFFEHLKFNNLEDSIERIKRFQFTSSTSMDSTRWRKAIYKLYFSKKIMIKYPDEFITSVQRGLSGNKIKYFFTHPILCINYFYLTFRRTLGAVFNRG